MPPNRSTEYSLADRSVPMPRWKRALDVAWLFGGFARARPVDSADRDRDEADRTRAGLLPTGTRRVSGKRFMCYKFRTMVVGADSRCIRPIVIN